MDTKEIKQELEELLKATERQIEGISSAYGRSEYGIGVIEGAKITLNLFKKDLEELLSEIEKSTQKPKCLLCTRSDNGCFIKGNKYEIKGTTSKGDYIIKDEYFEAEFTVKLNGYLWTFEAVSEDEEEIKVPKLLCTYSFSEYSGFQKGKTYEIIEKIDDDRYLTKDDRGVEGVVPLDGGLWKFDLI